MLQAAVLDCVPFDPFSFKQNGLPASEVDVNGREVFQTLVIALVIVVFDEPASDCGKVGGFCFRTIAWQTTGWFIIDVDMIRRTLKAQKNPAAP